MDYRRIKITEKVFGMLPCEIIIILYGMGYGLRLLRVVMSRYGMLADHFNISVITSVNDNLAV